MMELIQTQLQDRIGTLAFDHYAKRNALGADLIAEMLCHLDQFHQEAVGAVVIRSASDEPVWSSGHNVHELPLADLDVLHRGSDLGGTGAARGIRQPSHPGG
jgi:methylmalonyl-CoA decarboxylase